MEEIFYSGTKLLSMRDINGDLAEIFICDGNRSSGKSTYFNRYYVNSFLKKHQKFVILKRFSYELGNIADSFFTDIQRLFFKDFIMTQKKIANGMFVALYLQTRFEAEQNYPLTDANLCGYGVAINTADVVKKNSHFFSDVQRILFDEFQSENDQYCAREVEKFISIHTSMARGGGKQVRYLPVHMVSNGITILNPYYVEMGISERLQANTKFLKGDGFVMENNFNPYASQAQKTSAFNRAFAGNKYVQYASENVYLNDSKTFIDKPKGLSRYLATISYEQGKDASLLINLLRKNKLDHILLTLERLDFSNQDINAIRKIAEDLIESILDDDVKNNLNCLDYDLRTQRAFYLYPRLSETNLTERNVISTYRDVTFFQPDFTEEGIPKEDFIFPQSFYQTCLIKQHAVAKRSDNIEAMVDEVEGIEDGINLFDLQRRKDGSIWTISDTLMDMLFLLGLATDSLEVVDNVPREDWPEHFERGIPIVKRKI